MSWFSRSFGYGLGAAAGRFLFGDKDDSKRPPARAGEPIVPKTEAEIQADERRFDEEARRWAEEDRRR